MKGVTFMNCHVCGGNGEVDCFCTEGTFEYCDHCFGNGMVECPRCNGTGLID